MKKRQFIKIPAIFFVVLCSLFANTMLTIAVTQRAVSNASCLTVSGGTEGVDYTVSGTPGQDAVFRVLTSTELTFSTNGDGPTQDRIAVDASSLPNGANIVLNNVRISSAYSPVYIYNVMDNVTNTIKIKESANELKTTGKNKAAIQCGSSTDPTSLTQPMLRIVGDGFTSEGKLPSLYAATTGSFGAAIGGGADSTDRSLPNSYIAIENCSVSASACYDGAGIGGAGRGSAYVSITNATVNATGGTKGAGIGSGADGLIAKVVTSGTNQIDAKGGSSAAGIGSGCCSESSTAASCDIALDGAGTIVAKGGENATSSTWGGAAIGSGSGGSVNSISINAASSSLSSGLTITANGAYYAAGIGGGSGVSIPRRNVTSIVIGSATVNATGGNSAAGIGGGFYNGLGSIYIKEGANVNATAGSNACAIGCGVNANSYGKISISGKCRVYATAVSDVSAIGNPAAKTKYENYTAGEGAYITAVNASSATDPLVQVTLGNVFEQIKQGSQSWVSKINYLSSASTKEFTFWGDTTIYGELTIALDETVTNSAVLSFSSTCTVEGKLVNQNKMLKTGDATAVPTFVCGEKGVVSVNIVFDAKGGTFKESSAENAPTKQVLQTYQNATGLLNYAGIPDVNPPAGKSFLKWVCAEDASKNIADGQPVYLNGINCAASYSDIPTFTVSPQGGTVVASQEVKEGGKASSIC